MAEKAFDFFLEAYGPKYDKAVACLAKDRSDVLLGLLRHPEPSTGSTFAPPIPAKAPLRPCRLRTTKTKGCLSRMTVSIRRGPQGILG